ncbi:SIS domain-containing protein [Actinoplanes sp. NPDC051851]|uniref:SIS domain-containing protein n=1 Tax=Actinoplanes sp. NPDC051851 TaxID=3154753 RepID=UPI00343DC25F
MAGTVLDFIHEQPAMLRRLNDRVLAPEPAARRVVLVGSGTSYHASRIAAPAFGNAVAGERAPTGERAPAFGSVLATIPSEAPGLTADDLVIGVSQSGTSTGTLAVLRQARSAGARTVLVTAEPAPPFTPDRLVDIDCGPEPVGAKTKGFTATVHALRRLAGDARPVTAITGELIASAVEAARTVRPPTAVHIVTWGDWHPLADEGGLKILEMSLLPTEVWNVEEFLHGPHRRLCATSLLVIVGGDEPPRRHADALASFVHAIGAQALAVREKQEKGDVLGTVIDLQVLGVTLAEQRGISPEADPFPGFHSRLGSK